MPRLRRKDEHIFWSLLEKPGLADFSDINLIHNCLPERNLEEVSLETTVFGVIQRSPLFINAVTGGTPLARRVNAALAWVARECGLTMATGSQKVALKHPSVRNTFQVVRKINPAGNLWGNLGSYASPQQVREAIEMIDASAVQIHLNVPQELAMKEGDYQFRGGLQRIRKIVQSAGVPVIVKEVGFGIAREQAIALFESGVAALDVGGRGGTNFMAIENRRSAGKISPELLKWGIPTAISLFEVLSAVKEAGSGEVIAAGGMASSVNVAKALALGARAVGLAAWPVAILLKKGRLALVREIRKLEQELRLIMLMTGASSMDELRSCPLVVTGFTAQWLRRRGIDRQWLARCRKLFPNY